MLFYLASPYTNWKGGLDDAYHHACVAAVALIHEGINIYSPIVHCHPIAKLSGLDPLDAGLWERVNAPFIDAADGLIVLMMTRWNESIGVRHERMVFKGKPEFMLSWPITPNGIRSIKEAIK